MREKESYTINIKGHLINFDVPKVMGILNVTPDSFYSESRYATENEVRKKVESMIKDGVDIIDVGGCSTRPGFILPSEKEEWDRVNLGCRVIKEIAPDLPLSVDTFRAEIAKKAIIEWQVDIINDISGGIDPDMWETVAREKVVYVLTHNRMNGNDTYENVTAEVIKELSIKINQLHKLGVNDIIIDPGFGFSKNVDTNLCLFSQLNDIKRMGYPLLVGISRKSMVFKPLGISPEEALSATIALNALALDKGADILRVHDVKEANDTLKIYTRLKNSNI